MYTLAYLCMYIHKCMCVCIFVLAFMLILTRTCMFTAALILYMYICI